MKSLLPTWRLRAKAVATAAVVAVSLLAGAAAAHADGPVPPTLTDGFGLTQVGATTGTATNFVVTVTTPQVAGQHHIRIFLPNGYATNPAQRYPVLYLLHGAPDDPANLGGLAPYTSQSMITVIPDGGLRGWYSNWLDQKTAAGAQNWENFHINQVIPFIDANLRTIATKRERAVAGISMGGFGALHYAEHHPELFSQVATFSGDDDLGTPMRAAILATELNLPSVLTSGQAGDFGPVVSSDAIFGSPYWPFDGVWNAQDPALHMDRLAGLGISIYTGSNDILEAFVARTAQHAKASLDALGYPYHYVNYGAGIGWGAHCNGGHNYGCFTQDLVDYMPRLADAFATSPAA